MSGLAAPRVSIVIPVRNGRDYIFEALDSVLGQSFADFEVIVVDDGSTDMDYTRLTDIDPRVRSFGTGGIGVSGARNAGLRAACGELLTFLDADDVWCPGKLQAQVAYLDRHPEVGMVFGLFLPWRADAQGRFPPSSDLTRDCSQLTAASPERSGWLYARLLGGLLVGMNTAMIRRSVYEQIGGFRDDLHLGEDHELWIRTSQVAPMHCLDGVIALYRMHSDSAMHRRIPQVNVHALLLRMARARWGLDGPWGSGLSRQQFDARMAQLHFRHGYAHFWGGDLAVARGEFFRSLTLGHRPLRSLAYLALSQGKLVWQALLGRFRTQDTPGAR
jgi:glycosyltransferase involved in cell wall biosynthesis